MSTFRSSQSPHTEIHVWLGFFSGLLPPINQWCCLQKVYSNHVLMRGRIMKCHLPIIYQKNLNCSIGPIHWYSLLSTAVCTMCLTGWQWWPHDLRWCRVWYCVLGCDLRRQLWCELPLRLHQGLRICQHQVPVSSSSPQACLTGQTWNLSFYNKLEYNQNHKWSVFLGGTNHCCKRITASCLATNASHVTSNTYCTSKTFFKGIWSLPLCSHGASTFLALWSCLQGWCRLCSI